ncbi:MAG: hypothetical protein IT196_07990 [Acidimicrobiales bacterium]|nr:hypothetical protein [Acidimicrobiales bacterium]
MVPETTHESTQRMDTINPSPNGSDPSPQPPSADGTGADPTGLTGPFATPPGPPAPSADVSADDPAIEPAAEPAPGPGRMATLLSSPEQVISGLLTLIAVAVAMIFVWLQVQPHLLLNDNLASGGDMGAHVWGPDFLRREILSNFSLSGWTKDWYAGFPAYKFYMVVPALLIVALDAVPFVPYAVAFKLVSVSGLVTMPLAAWFMGRMFRLPYPGPALLAFGTLPFIFDFDERFRIIGGNAASTLAGEFSFSISLTLCLVYLGVVARGLETGRYRALGALLFALVMLNHLIPAMFAVVATLLLGLWRLAIDTRKPVDGIFIAGFVAAVAAAGWGAGAEALSVPVAVALPVVAVALLVAVSVVFEPGWRATLLWVAPVGILGAMVTGFWALPFVKNHAYFNDMGWERIQKYGEHLGPAKSLTTVWYAVFALCVIAVVLSIVDRVLIGGFLASAALTMGILFAAWPDTQMWNARFLPFYYLSLYLLAAVGLSLFVKVLPTFGLRSLGGTVAALGLLFAAALPLGVVPGSKLVNGQWSFNGTFTAPQSFVKSWAKWNYSGYQGKDAWPEYNQVVTAMANLGQERGCGRVMWEYQTEKLNSYGTPMSLMLLPYWTKGCLGSMEGLYFESSATTPYHFMNQSELSEAPSRAQRDLPYSSLDVDLGVQHLQLMGVRYYMALTDAAKRQADANADLTFLLDTGPWSVYEVSDSELVEPVENLPAVVDLAQDQADWLEPSAEYYNDPDRWDVLLAADGPAEWERIAAGADPVAEAAPKTTVSNIVEGQDSISFEVDEVGVPVLVKSSYFPNWKVDGAAGPCRVMPNLMVVVPTEQRVTLHDGRTGVDGLGVALTLAGLAGVFWLGRSNPPTWHRPIRVRPAIGPDELDLSRYQLTFLEPEDGPRPNGGVLAPVGAPFEPSGALFAPPGAPEPPAAAAPPARADLQPPVPSRAAPPAAPVAVPAPAGVDSGGPALPAVDLFGNPAVPAPPVGPAPVGPAPAGPPAPAVAPAPGAEAAAPADPVHRPFHPPFDPTVDPLGPVRLDRRSLGRSGAEQADPTRPIDPAIERPVGPGDGGTDHVG